MDIFQQQYVTLFPVLFLELVDGIVPEGIDHLVGKILGGKRDFKQWKFARRSSNFDMFVNMTYTLTGAPPGSYVIETTLKDLNSKEKATVRNEVEIQ